MMDDNELILSRQKKLESFSECEQRERIIKFPTGRNGSEFDRCAENGAIKAS